MQTAMKIKQTAQELIDGLPDDASWDSVLYTLQVRKDIEEGLADVEKNRVFTSEQLKKEFGIES